MARYLLTFALLAWGSGSAAAAGDATRGEALARTHCGACHAIGRSGTSTNTAAPPFRDLHRRYPVDQLAESLAEGIVTGHADMPAFELSEARIDDLIAYLRTLERP